MFLGEKHCFAEAVAHNCPIWAFFNGLGRFWEPVFTVQFPDALKYLVDFADYFDSVD